jgi:hypothetical protein
MKNIRNALAALFAAALLSFSHAASANRATVTVESSNGSGYFFDNQTRTAISDLWPDFLYQDLPGFVGAVSSQSWNYWQAYYGKTGYSFYISDDYELNLADSWIEFSASPWYPTDPRPWVRYSLEYVFNFMADYGSLRVERISTNYFSGTLYRMVVSGGEWYDISTASLSYTPLNAVPEPETYAMLLAGLGLIGVVARRRRKTLFP